MLNTKHKIYKLLIVVSMIFFLFPCCKAAENSDLYGIVWNMVNDDYIDSTKNGQDWDYWKLRYQNKLLSNDDSYIAIDSMLKSLNDEHTKFLRPKQFNDVKKELSLLSVGIGVILEKKEGKILVKKVLSGSTAEKKGLKINEQIVSVDDKNVCELNEKDVYRLLKGKRNTFVKITIKSNDDKLKTYKIKRDIVKTKSISNIVPENNILDENIGYIRIKAFAGTDIVADFKNELKKNKNKKGLIIDIRNNLGGLFDETIKMSDLLLPKNKIIVKTLKSDGKENIIFSKNRQYYKGNIVILTNKMTVSAAEIFAGALADNKSAIILGEQTYGKGYIQEIKNIPPYKAGLCLTVEKYKTPNGSDINEKGITPQIYIKQTSGNTDKNTDVQLQEAQKILLKTN